MSLPKAVKLVEVGPRDGLQNEQAIIPADIKINLINKLSETGLSVIEATSFVSPIWVPQMADHKEVYKGILKKQNVDYPVLIPNLKGFQAALAVGVKSISVFAAASETFSRKNINCSIEESLNRFAEVIQLARQHGMTVRGYISCVIACPYEGEIQPEKVTIIAERLLELGCYEISLGDTIGVGTPNKVIKLIESISQKVSLTQLAVHFHDTYGQALANIYTTLEKGIAIIDSACAGLGGCPYAPGASGNVATEDVLYMLNGLGIHTGVDIEKICLASDYITEFLGITSRSKAGLALSRSNK